MVNTLYEATRIQAISEPNALKIACTSFYLPPHDRIGAGYQMHYIANAYVQHGHEVTMFSPNADKSEDALYELVQIPVGLRNRVFHFGWNMRKQDFSGYDVLHTGGGEMCWLMGKKRPYHIGAFHGSCFAEAMHIQGAKNRLRMALLGLQEIALCAVADRKVCVSHNTRRYIPLVREVIWNGVDLTTFKPGAVKSPHPVILFVGTMDHRKRGGALLDIFQREIRPVLPDAELWIVREQNPVIAEGVRWFGPVPLEKLVELYQQAWVFCLPSSYEGFGVPYIEAMACGTAVAATPNVGALEVLANGKYGRIADLPGLGQVLLELLKDTTQRQRMEQIGLERAQTFSWEKVVRAYLSTVPNFQDPFSIVHK